ncbi:hypothetical protein R1flu_004402 [Riccia fluitans]|uniref:Uncharacterized protein n=1 Tax=Riccia fluitans TaxID=41844 RepID=A0ABD1YQG7_9MARC
MAPRSSRNLKTKEVKIPHLIVANRKKMETWGLGGLFAVDWSGTYDNLEKEDSKKHKALIQTVSDSDTKTDTEDEKEPKEEVPCAFCEGEASGSKPLDQKIDYAEWEICLENLGRETSKLFEAFHVEIGSVTMEAVARNMKEMFTPPPVAKTDIQPWREMVKTLANFLTEEQKRNKVIVEQRDYFEGKNRCLEKISAIAMWYAQ